MIGFRDDALAININQADAAFGMVAVADITYRDLHGDMRMSHRCPGKRRRLSKRSYPGSTLSVRPVGGHGGCGGTSDGTPMRPFRRSSQAGGAAATLWATLVIQRALSS